VKIRVNLWLNWPSPGLGLPSRRALQLGDVELFHPPDFAGDALDMAGSSPLSQSQIWSGAICHGRRYLCQPSRLRCSPNIHVRVVPCVYHRLPKPFRRFRDSNRSDDK
jgi:hypothetical protein